MRLGPEPGTDPHAAPHPELASVVTAVELAPDVLLVHLANGQTYDPTKAGEFLAVGTLAAGSLFLAGTQPAPWYGHIQEWTPGCYRLDTRGLDRGATIATEAGLLLTKTPDFVAPDDTDGVYDTPLYVFCLDKDGRATAYR